MVRGRGRRSGATSWGALACCFSTVCVCATAVIITEMILSRSREGGPEPAPRVVAARPAAAPPTAMPQALPKAAPQVSSSSGLSSAAPPPLPPEAPAPLKVEGNLVQNGGFEELGGEGASLFEHWGYWGRWEKGNYTLESVPGRTGKHAARMSCVTPGRGGLSQRLQGCKPGDKLQITFWAKADNAAGGRLFLNLEGTPGDGWASLDIRPGTYDWQEFTKVVTCPPSAAPDYHIAIFFYNKSQGSFTVDDVAAVKMAP